MMMDRKLAADIGPCSVGKEATREAQNRGRSYRGVAGLASSSPGAARASFISIFAQDLDPGLRAGSVVSCFWTVFPCACIVGSTGTEKPIVAGVFGHDDIGDKVRDRRKSGE